MKKRGQTPSLFYDSFTTNTVFYVVALCKNVKKLKNIIKHKNSEKR